jgi:DNA invertase Pin-like site-specific DNA recombinase
MRPAHYEHALASTPGPSRSNIALTPDDADHSGRCLFTNQPAGPDNAISTFGIFAALAEFERELIRERTIAGLSSARARGRKGGRPYTMTPAKLRLAQAAMATRFVLSGRNGRWPRGAIYRTMSFAM